MAKARKCPRWGYIKLNTRNRAYFKETVCKTWGCPVCRKKQLAKVQMTMEYGCLMLGRCYLITLTQKYSEEDGCVDAVFVAKAWAALLRCIKKKSPNLSWIRVIETTKKGIPHLHLIVGGLGDRKDNRHGKYPPYSAKFILEECDCLIHEWGKEWYERTGNFVVHAEEVYSAVGVGRYLGKYLSKGFGDRGRLESLGFARRWSASRNWPRCEPLRLRGSVEGKWISTEIIPRFFQRERMDIFVRRDENSELCLSVGDDLAVAIGERLKHAGRRKKIERISDAFL